MPLPNSAAEGWAAASARLARAVAQLPHPRVREHLAGADALLQQSGPSTAWADRIAAIAVISERQADLAPTTASREAHLEAATAAYDLLAWSRHLHGIEPCAAAVRELRGSPHYTSSGSGAPNAASSSGLRNSSTNS